MNLKYQMRRVRRRGGQMSSPTLPIYEKDGGDGLMEMERGGDGGWM
jgi:hypothetical protein